LQALASEVGVAADQIILFSSTTGRGRDELAEALVALLAQPGWKEA
jgi:GTP-binding protein